MLLEDDKRSDSNKNLYCLFINVQCTQYTKDEEETKFCFFFFSLDDIDVWRESLKDCKK